MDKSTRLIKASADNTWLIHRFITPEDAAAPAAGAAEEAASASPAEEAAPSAAPSSGFKYQITGAGEAGAGIGTFTVTFECT